MSIIGDRIKMLRKEKGYTREEFAKYIDIPPTTLRNYELGTREPGHPFIVQMSYIFNVSTDYLLGITDDKRPSKEKEKRISFNEQELIIKYRNLDDYGKDLVDTVLNKEHERCVKEQEEKYQPTTLKPFYLSGLSAGTGLYVFDDVPSEQIPVPIEYKDIDFVVKVTGNSMEPSYFENEKVMIKKQSQINIGEIGAFMINGDAYIKELGKDGLISHNKNYPLIEFKDDMRIDCIGKVIGKL